MPGAGIKAISLGSNSALTLDITRLLSRAGRPAPTGIDRVERAYLRAFLDSNRPVFGIARTAAGTCLLDRGGLAAFADRVDGAVPWGPVDLAGRLSRKLTPARRQAEADLRRLAIATGPLRRVLRHVPGGTYYNVGHSHLTAEVMDRTGAAGLTRVVLVHDTLPLDHPEYQRPETPARFRQKLDAAGRADHILATTKTGAADIARHLPDPPPITVAPLGVDIPEPGEMACPEAPYVVVISTIEPRKNHALLLDIWEGFQTDPPDGPVPDLHIIGARGWENRALFARLDTSPVMGRTVFEHGPLPDPQAAALLAGARAALFPSHAEGYGLPPLEALALGIPVICASLQIYRETLGNMPIYAGIDDVYRWRKEILNLVSAEQTTDHKTVSITADFRRPTWDGHFEIALHLE